MDDKQTEEFNETVAAIAERIDRPHDEANIAAWLSDGEYVNDVEALAHDYLGDSYSIVKPYFAPNANEIPTEQTRYYDLTTLGSQGIGRRHGWFDPQSRYIVQTG